MDILDKVLDMNTEIFRTYSKAIELNNRSIGFTADIDGIVISEELPQNLIDFYKVIAEFKIEWEAKKLKFEGRKITGRIKIPRPEDVLGDWSELLNTEDNEVNPEMSNFKIVDLCDDQACVGFYHDKDNRVDYLEYLELSQSETEPLDLNFNGYLELIFMTRGFSYWQLVILHLRNGSGYESRVDEFKTFMPQLFPDFRWEDFVALYERVRIK